MLAFGRFLQQSGDDGAADRAVAAQVEQLVARVAEAVVLQDRRDALAQLRDLLTSGGGGGGAAAAAFGAAGFPLALGIVREREDRELVQLALESLSAAVGGGGDGAGGDAAAAQAAAVNAAQLAREGGAVAALLGLLEAPPAGTADFYARYHALQALKGLAAAAPGQLQEAVLSAPLGMSRLLSLLGDPAEALRADALLLAAALARGSPDLAQLAAFEGAFDRLFAIIEEEGGAEGGIEVQDCLALLAALLGASPRCRLLFAEGGHLPRLPPLLALPPPGSGPHPPALPPQHAANLAAALEVVAALLPPPAGGQAAAAAAAAAEGSREALARLGLADALVGLGLEGGGAGDGGVRALALLCLAALASSNRPQQDRLAAATVAAPGGGARVPLLLAAARAAVGCQLPDEAAAADRLLEAYCLGNAAGQAVLASALLASAAPPPDSLAGFLLSSIGRHQGGWEEAACAARAACALAHLLTGSPGLQPHLLSLQLPADGGGGASGGGTLMEAVAALLGALVTRHGRRPEAAAAAAAALRLLLLWLHACPPAVTAFLRAVARSQPFLIDSIRGSNACSGAAASAHPVSRGMLAALLGTCAVHAEDAPGTPSAAQLLGAIDAQIGRDSFLKILAAMLQHTAVTGAAAATGAAALGGGGPTLSPASAAFLVSLAGEVRQRVAGPTEAPQLPAAAANAGGGHSGEPPAAPRTDSVPSPAWVPPPPAAAAGSAPAYPPAGGTRQEQAGAPAAAAKPAQPLAAAPAPPNGFGPAAQEALESENRRLRAELAALRSQHALAGDGAAAEAAEARRAAAEAEAAAERARGDAAAAQAAAQKLEADLQDLSAAYSTLDAHAAELQQQVESLRQQLAASGDGGGGGNVAQAVEAARAEAAAEAEEAMSDLLVCLGQEEAKVARLRERLEATGVDCDALLADIIAAGEEGAGQDDDLT